MPHDAPVQSAAQPFTRDSREYWTDVSASELQQGVKLPLTAPGAIIRLSPSDAAVGTLQSARGASCSWVASRCTLDHAAHAARRRAVAACRRHGRARRLDGAEAQARAGQRHGHPAGTGRQRPLCGARVRTAEHAALSARRPIATTCCWAATCTCAWQCRMPAATSRLSAVGGFLRAPDGSTTILDYQRQADGSYTVDAQPREHPVDTGPVGSAQLHHRAPMRMARRCAATPPPCSPQPCPTHA